MSFIIENGALKVYTGSDTNIVIPDEVKEFAGAPAFLGREEPFTLTLSPNMTCRFGDLLSEGIAVLNIPAGTKFTCSDCSPNHTSFYTLLKEINVDPANESCASVDGILYNKEMTILYACPAAYEGNVEIPETVKIIGRRAFSGCKLIKEIVLPDSVTTIEEQAFADCKVLKKLVLSDNLTNVGREAFLRCGKITSAGPKGGKKNKFNLEFPWTVKIPENAFSGLKSLKQVVLPETITEIGKNAFKACKSLESINLPANVKCDKKLFKDCVKLSVGE